MCFRGGNIAAEEETRHWNWALEDRDADVLRWGGEGTPGSENNITVGKGNACLGNIQWCSVARRRGKSRQTDKERVGRMD